MKQLRLFLFVFIFSAIGCASAESPQHSQARQPLSVAGIKIPPLVFRKFDPKIKPGTVIGESHFLGIHDATYYFEPEGDQSQLKKIIDEEMKAVGYYGVDEKKLRYVLDGELLETHIEVHRKIAGSFNASSCLIKWYLRDLVTKSVLYQAKTRGFSEKKGVGFSSVLEARRAAFRDLLSQGEFVDTLKGSPFKK